MPVIWVRTKAEYFSIAGLTRFLKIRSDLPVEQSRSRMSAARKTQQRGSDFGGGHAHRVFIAAQNCSVTAVVSSVTFQPFVSAFSLANFCSA